jgi:hypothetical protein
LPNDVAAVCRIYAGRIDKAAGITCCCLYEVYRKPLVL